MDRFIGKVIDKVIGDDDDDAKKQQSQGKFSVQLSWRASLTARLGPLFLGNLTCGATT